MHKSVKTSHWQAAVRGIAVACALLASQSHTASAFPERPVRVVVPTGAGGITDLLARIVTEKLSTRMGQPVIVDNRTGASGIIGSDIVAKAQPDGHTLLMVFPTHPVNPSLYRSIPYNTVNDFAPITMVGSVALVLVVNPSFPAKSIKELIAIARDKPGQLNYGSAGRGTLAFLAAELFASTAGVKLTNITYKGVVQGQTALLSGEVQIYFSPVINAIPQLKAGKMRALGVTPGKQVTALPDVPTISESGLPGYEVTGWNGLLAPAKTPRAVIQALHGHIVGVLQMPEVVAQFRSQGVEPIHNTPEQFLVIIKNDIQKWGKLIRSLGIKPE
jgi:tripartite-type tricarboxylate transporter receptor subunit TctC